MSVPLKVLIVEDNPNDADLLVLELIRGGFDVEHERVDTPADFLAALPQKQWDLIFSDHTMPKFSSLQALNLRNQSGLDIPFIILSGTMGEDLAVEAMRAGASDYFVKGGFTRLISAVNRELQESRQRAAGRQSEWELEHFVASLTHDLRTPILAESRILELLASGNFGELNPTQSEVVGELIQSNQFVQHMVQNLLFTYKYRQRKVTLHRDPTDMQHYIAGLAGSLTIRSLLQEKQQTLVIQPVETLTLVELDRHEVQRVVFNLIKNASEATPIQGRITISFQGDEQQVSVHVRDTGCGVDPALEPYLFTMYAPAAVKKYRKLGLGLGLYLSRKIIAAHGGQIGYRKQEGGSLFYFTLPVTAPLLPPENAENPSETLAEVAACAASQSH